MDGAILVAERTHPELANPRGRARLVVLAGEVGGRSEETREFLTLLAKAQERCDPTILRKKAEQVWIELCGGQNFRSFLAGVAVRWWVGWGCPHDPCCGERPSPRQSERMMSACAAVL